MTDDPDRDRRLAEALMKAPKRRERQIDIVCKDWEQIESARKRGQEWFVIHRVERDEFGFKGSVGSLRTYFHKIRKKRQKAAASQTLSTPNESRATADAQAPPVPAEAVAVSCELAGSQSDRPAIELRESEVPPLVVVSTPSSDWGLGYKPAYVSWVLEPSEVVDVAGDDFTMTEEAWWETTETAL
jgi:hypothetical protein